MNFSYNANKDVFKQVEVYKKANRTDKYIIVIFYFTKDEYNTAPSHPIYFLDSAENSLCNRMGYLLNINRELSMICLYAAHILTNGLPVSRQGV